MRFIHMADMHFDTPFRDLSEKGNLGDIRRLEQRNSFNKMIEYIKSNNIPFLFISGDLYEHEYIRNSTIEFINNLFKTIPETKIFIAPGNHDPLLKNSCYNTFNWSENVNIFNNEIKTYEFEDVDIYGFGFADFYCNNSGIENIKIKNKEKINILIIHADLDASLNSNMAYNPINKNKLNNIGFDYVALGHIHKANYNQNDGIVYPGSAISLGFDELGDHGMLDVELNKNKLKINFIKLDKINFEEINLDISEMNSEENLIENINKLKIEENKLYKIILIGNKNFEININKIINLLLKENIIKIKDNSKINEDIYKLINENNLKGLFIKEVLKKFEAGEIDEETMKKTIEIGTDAL